RCGRVLLGAVAVAVLSRAEVLLIALPDARPDWASEPLALIAPVARCAAGFLLHSWYRRASLLRWGPSMRVLPVVIGMVLAALVVGALALGGGLLYLRTGQLEFHTGHTGAATALSEQESTC